VRDRLTQRARAAGENVQLILTRYAIERLLYRLSVSQHRERFILKGAIPFSLWGPTPYRATGDLDLLGAGNPERRGTTPPIEIPFGPRIRCSKRSGKPSFRAPRSRWRGSR
jgi:hypothetical protein